MLLLLSIPHHHGVGSWKLCVGLPGPAWAWGAAVIEQPPPGVVLRLGSTEPQPRQLQGLWLSDSYSYVQARPSQAAPHRDPPACFMAVEGEGGGEES